MTKTKVSNILKGFSVFSFFCFSVFLFSACGGPDPVNSPDGGQEDGGAVAADGGVNDGGTDGGVPANDGGSVDGGVDGGQIADGGPAYDGGTDGGNPLADYMWIQGSWQESLFCTTVLTDGGITGCSSRGRQPVAVTVDSWDDTNGATVTGFNPMRTIYVKKNGNEFDIHIDYQQSGGSCNGTADHSNLTMKMRYKASSDSQEYYFEWEKQ